MHNNKNISHSTDKYVQFERIYKKIKHICVGIFLVFFIIGILLVLALLIYFHRLTKEAK